MPKHRRRRSENSQLWSVRLGGPGQLAVTIALGELRDNRPTYLPERVVVLFGQQQPEDYCAYADLRAWGADLPLDDAGPPPA